MFEDMLELGNGSLLVMAKNEYGFEWPYLLVPHPQGCVELDDLVAAAPHEMEGPLPEVYVRRINGR